MSNNIPENIAEILHEKVTDLPAPKRTLPDHLEDADGYQLAFLSEQKNRLQLEAHALNERIKKNADDLETHSRKVVEKYSLGASAVDLRTFKINRAAS